MSFQDEYKITSADRLDKGVYGLPDTPGMTTAAIQERLDSLGNLAIDKFNALVEAASDVVDGSDTKFPTNKAVEDYISGEGGAIIDDTTPSLHKAYSSQKVENMFGDVASRVIDDTEPLSNKTYSSAEIEEKLSNIPSPESIIDDDTASTDTTYSSSKLESDFISISDTEEQTATDEFSTYNGGLLSSLKVSLSPNQDLHGYDHPWVGGAGKNKLPITVDSIKALNGGASSWNGNSKVFNGVTVTLNTDNNGNLISITTSGTASGGNANLFLVRNISFSTSFVSGTPSGSTGNNYYIRCDKDGTYYTDSGNGVAINGTFASIWIGIANGITAPSNPWLPMVESGSAKTSYEPYSNICPISGHTQVDVDVSDGQTTQEQVTVNLGGTYYSGTLDVVSGVFVPDTAEAVYNGTENWHKNANYSIFYLDIPSNYQVSQTPMLSAFKGVEPQSTSSLSTKSGCAGLYANLTGININADFADETAFKTWLSNNPLQVIYKLASPQSIQLSPTMVKALVGENHLSAPLEGQTVDEVKYRPLAEWNDVVQDSKASDDTTYSSNKINSIIPQINDSAASASSVYSSNKVEALIAGIPSGVQIDDDNESYTTTYSSAKIVELINGTRRPLTGTITSTLNTTVEIE